MAGKMTVLVGTIGQGVMRSADGGETWRRMGIDQGLHSDALVRTLHNDPRRPETVYAGTDLGLYKSEDAGHDWKLVDSPLSKYHVWALASAPGDPDVMFAGTGTPKRCHVLRSTDAGKSWEPLSVEIAETCPNVGVPRVTAIAFDPENQRSIWVGLEVDGARHSIDGGETWTAINGGIPNPDVHNIAVAAGPPKTVIVVVNNEVYTSTDDGASWNPVGIRQNFPYGYPRGIKVQPDNSKVVFVTIGDTTPGSVGTIMRSSDTGQTWEELPMSAKPNTAMWVVNSEPSDPKTMWAGSRYGYLYRSEDGGDSWQKLSRELSEISSLLCVSV